MMNREVRIQETDRTVEIKNPQDVLKYKVILKKTQKTDYTEDELVDVYNVLVYSYVDDPNGQKFPPSEDFFTLKDAEIEFNKTVKNYTILVKAQSKPVDDISVYAEKIGYALIDPNCCFNCKFCNHGYDKCETAHHKSYRRHYLVCENPENFTVFENLHHPRPYSDFNNPYFDNGFHPSMHDRHHDTWGGMKRTEIDDVRISNIPECHNNHPHYVPNPHPGVPRNPHFYSLEVRPRVHFNGICKRYEREVPRKHRGDFCPDNRIFCDDIVGLKKFVDERIDLIDRDVDNETNVDNG